MKISKGSSSVSLKRGGSGVVARHSSVQYVTAPVGAGPVGDYSDTTLGTVGTPGDFGFDSPSVARWNVVEFQEVAEFAYVGLVAFHVNHVAKVEFSIDGGAWTEVTEMVENPSTGVYEYFVAVDTAGLADDRELELRAKITPSTAGQVYGIDPITIVSGYSAELVGWCDPSGSDSTGDASELNPCRTPHKALQLLVGSTSYTEKVTIYCKAGEYVPASSTYSYNPPTGSGWFTITSAPGVDAASVVFRSSIDSGTISYAGIRTSHTRYKNVSFETGVTGRDFSDGTKTNVWIDNVAVTLTAAASSVNNIWQSNTWGRSYCTGCTFSNFNSGPYGAKLVRDCSFDTLTADAMNDCRLVANATVTNQLYSPPAHPDLLQILDSSEHTVHYGVVGLDILGQSVFCATEELLYQNAAFVNVLTVLDPGATIDSAPVSQLRNSEVTTLAFKNIIVDSCTILNGQNFIIDQGSSPSETSGDVVFRNNVVCQLSTNLSAPAIAESGNWYTRTDLDGSFACAGGGSFSQTATATYKSVADLVPSEASMVGVVSRPTIKTDATGSPRRGSGIIGALG